MTATLAVSTATAVDFSDINPGDQYYDAIQFVGGLGLIDAINGDFEPDTYATRAVALTALYRMAGSPAVTYIPVYSDVPEYLPFTNAVMWAYNAGIINDFISGTFNPDTNVTRQEFAAMLLGAASIRVPVTADLSVYYDADEVSNWAEKGMGWCVSRNLIEVNGSLNPAGNISRGAIASSLFKLQELKDDPFNIWVLNPIPSRSPIIATPLAPRIDDWSGKTILVLANYNGTTGTIAARIRALVGDDVRLLWAGNMTVINGQTTNPSSPPSTGNWQPRITFTPADASALMTQVNAGTLAANNILRQVDAVISGAGF